MPVNPALNYHARAFHGAELLLPRFAPLGAACAAPDPDVEPQKKIPMLATQGVARQSFPYHPRESRLGLEPMRSWLKRMPA
jgi:hypothetical protein